MWPTVRTNLALTAQTLIRDKANLKGSGRSTPETSPNRADKFISHIPVVHTREGTADPGLSSNPGHHTEMHYRDKGVLAGLWPLEVAV